VLQPPPLTPPRGQVWLMAGHTLQAGLRSPILEVVTRLLFHPIVLFSVYLTTGVIAAIAAWARLAVEDNALLAGLRNNQHTNQYIGNRPRFAGRWESMVHRFQQHYVESLRDNPR